MDWTLNISIQSYLGSFLGYYITLPERCQKGETQIAIVSPQKNNNFRESAK